MPRYLYTAKSQPGKEVQGALEAESAQEAVTKLAALGYFPISLQPETAQLADPAAVRFIRIPRRDVIVFTRQLASLLESGITILNALTLLASQTPNKYLRLVLNDSIAAIKDGKSFSESLRRHPKVFPELYTSLVYAGEAGGTLEGTIKRLADFLEKEEEFRTSVKAALTYPAFVFIVSILTVAVLLGFVIPRLVTMFEDMGQILPLPTRILIMVSGFLRHYWWVFVAAGVGIVFFLRRLTQSAQGKILWDSFSLRLWLYGELVAKTEMSRLLRTLSLLLSSGLSIVQSLDIGQSILTNEVFRRELQQLKEQISRGTSLSAFFRSSRLFPQYLTNIVAIGEETGTLEKALLRVADEYERQVDGTLKTATRLLEPVIILSMGLVVGFIVLAMLLPIFQINLIVR